MGGDPVDPVVVGEPPNGLEVVFAATVVGFLQSVAAFMVLVAAATVGNVSVPTIM